MGYRPITYCRQCNEPLDVYEPPEKRFCSEECYDEFKAEFPEIIKRDEAYASARDAY